MENDILTFLKRTLAMVMAIMLLCSAVPIPVYAAAGAAGTGSVTFTVTTEDSGNADGAQVTLTGQSEYNQTQTVSDGGSVTFSDLAAGEYSYTVILDGYETASGNVTVTVTVGEEAVSQAVTLKKTSASEPTTYTVTFAVTDGANPVPGATVTMTDTADGVKTYTGTDDGSEGKVNVTGVPAGTYSYTVEVDGYVTYNSSENISVGDTDPQEVSVILTPVKGTVTVTVTSDGTSPVSGASVSLKSEDIDVTDSPKSTDGSGKAEFSDLEDGEYTVTVTAEGYKTQSDTVTVSAEDGGRTVEKTVTLVAKAEQPPLTFEDNYPTALVVGQEYTYTAVGGSSDIAGEIEYSLENNSGNYAEIDSQTGKVTTKEPGTVTVKAVKPGDKDHKDAEATTENITISAAKFAFKQAQKEDTNFDIPAVGNTFKLELINKSEGAEIKYTLKDVSPAAGISTVSTVDGNSEYISLDPDGKIAVTKATPDGTYVEITATETVSGSSSSTATFRLTVSKVPQKLTFNNKTTIEFDESFTANAASDAVGLTSSIQYSVESGGTGAATINESTGELHVTKAGTIKIKAEVKGDPKYEDASATFELTVNPWFPKETPYTVNGTQSNGWYNVDVNIEANDGYTLINSENEAPFTGGTVSAEGENTVSFRVKCTKEGSDYDKITGVYTETIKIDKTAPKATITAQIQGNSKTWEELLSALTFGLYDNKQLTFTVTSDDTKVDVSSVSGVSKTEYYVDENPETPKTKESLEALAEWKTYSSGISVDPDKQFVVYVKVTDTAGNAGYASSDGVILETGAPTITVDHDTDEIFYKDEVTVNVTVQDADDVKSGLKSVKYQVTKYGVNESEQTADHSGEVNFPITLTPTSGQHGTISATVTAEDNAGNVSEKEFHFKFVSETPTVNVTFDSAAPTVDGGAEGLDYYNAARTATITVNCWADAFDEGKVNISDKNITVGEWSHDGDTHTATLTFSGSHSYDGFTVNYTDKAGNKAAAYENTDKFVVDIVAPTGSVSINDHSDIWNKLIETLTFGIWRKSAVTATFNGSDEVSTAELAYYLDRESGSVFDASSLISKTWTPTIDDGTLEIPDEGQFTVYLKITDTVGHVTYVSSNGIVVDQTPPDGITIALPETQHKHGDVNVYNADITATVGVSDNDAGSGIKSVDYTVTKDGAETQSGNLYTFTVPDPTKDQLVHSLTDLKIELDASENDSCDVVISVTATDNAGNQSTQEQKVDFDVTKPVIAVDGMPGSFTQSSVTATVTVTERAAHFVAGNAVITQSGGSTTSWTTVGDTHTAAVTFSEDGVKSLEVNVTDMAGNEAAAYSGSFTKDSVAPTGSIEIGTKIWNDLIETLTFGRWSKTGYTAEITANDATSVTIEYYVDNTGSAAKTLEELGSVAWTVGSVINVAEPDPQRFTVYAKLTDQAGNTTYLSSDGHVIDSVRPSVSISPASGTFNRDVTVSVSASDQSNGAGIKKVSYSISGGGSATLYELGEESPTADQLLSSFSGSFTINASSHNSSGVGVTVTVEDNAGNISTASGSYDIDITAPTVSLSFDNNNAYKNDNGHGYFNAGRTATISVTERGNHFNASAVLSAISITAVDGKGNTVIADTRSLISQWSSSGSGDSTVHTAKISFTEDAKYTLNIGGFSDSVGNSSRPLETGSSVTPFSFTVDKTAPTASVTADGLGTWDTLLESLTFGLWTPMGVRISGSYDDTTSGIESVSVYRTDLPRALTRAELDEITEWQPFSSFIVPTDEQFAVYLKVVDNCGNVTYVSTDGIIVDESLPKIESIAPNISITPPRPVNGIYDGDVPVAVSVVDPVMGDTHTYSGLKEIRYTVSNMGTVTQSGTLYSFTSESPAFADLLQVWERQDAILVNGELNNSNDVEIRVFATDNAGNSNELAEYIKIDMTAPTVTVTYDNNDGDTTFGDGAYFNRVRHATITVTERNFDPMAVQLTLTGSNGYVPALSGWVTITGAGNGDGTTHTATLTYDRDGDYTFDIALSDMVGNRNSDVNYGGSVAPKRFTVDLTAPALNISFDNNSVQNGNYYNAARTATLTIAEHNFDLSRLNVAITATDNGQRIELPVVSQWSNSADTHTATVTFDRDALYTFDVTFSDMAGNPMADMDEQVFYVDTTAPRVVVSGIADGSANNSDGNIGFTVSASDTNMDLFTPILTAIMRSNGEYETRTVELGEPESIVNGLSYTVTNLQNDGIYRLMCTAVDKSGNSFTEVVVEEPNSPPKTLDRSGAESLVTFTVNRHGSAFELDETTLNMVKNRYVQNVTSDVIITEINPDRLTASSVTLNGVELTAGTDYSVEESGDSSPWHRYTYRVYSSAFADEGEYSLVVASTDEANNNAFSDIKDAAVSFVVDRTPPVVTISGLDTDGRYQVESQTVTLIPTDDGGEISTLIVNLIDDDGNVIKELINMTGEEVENAIHTDGYITFLINEGLFQNVQIRCADKAMDLSTASSNEYNQTYSNVSVSTSALAIFWANRALRYGVLGGATTVIAGAAGTVVFVSKRRFRKNKA